MVRSPSLPTNFCPPRPPKITIDRQRFPVARQLERVNQVKHRTLLARLYKLLSILAPCALMSGRSQKLQERRTRHHVISGVFRETTIRVQWAPRVTYLPTAQESGYQGSPNAYMTRPPSRISRS